MQTFSAAYPLVRSSDFLKAGFQADGTALGRAWLPASPFLRQPRRCSVVIGITIWTPGYSCPLPHRVEDDAEPATSISGRI
jgi:hypothetical protein